MPKDCPDCKGDNLCKWHSRRLDAKTPKPLKKTPLKKKGYTIRKRTKKRAGEERIYSKERLKFLEDNPICQCGRIDENGKVCERLSTEIQHSMGRENGLLLNKKFWMATSAECRVWEISNPKQAQETGIAKRRNVSIELRNEAINPTGGQ